MQFIFFLKSIRNLDIKYKHVRIVMSFPLLYPIFPSLLHIPPYSALAASAPIWEFTGLIPCTTFFDTVSHTWYGTSKACGDNLHNSYKTLRQVATHGECRIRDIICLTRNSRLAKISICKWYISSLY